MSLRVSVGDVIETALWLVIPYMIAGLAWAFFHVEEIWQMEDVLRSRLPARGAIAAYPLVAALWPAYLVVPAVCGL